MTTTTTLSEFISTHSIRMTSDRTDSNPHMEDTGRMDHWKCLLKSKGRSLTVYFSKGYGHHGKEPSMEEVLDCLASDASGVENSPTFEDFCGEYGYDTDSRRAERTFKTCVRFAAKLKAFLGDPAYQELLWNTERL